MNAAIKQRHGFEGFHLAGQVRRIPSAGQSIGYTRLVAAGFILGIATAIGSIVKRNARPPLLEPELVSRRPVSDRWCEPPTHFSGSEKRL
jgi:hypothetical protein